MQVERYAQLLRAGEQPIETRIIQKAPFGQAVDHPPTETVHPHAPLEYIRRRGGFLHRQVGKASVAVGVIFHGAGERVVGFAGESRALCARQQISSGSGQRKHLDRDTVRIHVIEPRGAHVGQLGLRRVHDGRGLLR